MIFAKLKKSGLLCFGHCLGAAGFDKVAPQKPPAIDLYEAGERHRTGSAIRAA
jgi:hypothetical protein